MSPSEVIALVSVCVTGLVGIVTVLANVWMKRGDRAHDLAVRAQEEQQRHEQAWWAKREQAYEELQPLLARITRIATMSLGLHISKCATEAQIEAIRGEISVAGQDLVELSVQHGAYMSRRVNYLCMVMSLSMIEVHTDITRSGPHQGALGLGPEAMRHYIAEEVRIGPQGADSFDDETDVRRQFPQPSGICKTVGLIPADPPKPD